jgi:hypothetical protein
MNSEYDFKLLEWAHKYDAYKRLASDSSLLLEVLRPLREAFERDEVIPEWAGVDLLRGWAFYIARAYHWGGYAPLRVEFPEIEAIVEAISNHPSARATDRPPKRTS